MAFTAAVYWGSSGLAGGVLAPSLPPPPAAPARPDSSSVRSATRTPWSANRRRHVSMSRPSRSANRGALAMVPRPRAPDARSHGGAGGRPALRTPGTLVYAAASTATAVARALSPRLPGGHDAGDGGLARRRAVRHHDDVRPRRGEPLDPPGPRALRGHRAARPRGGPPRLPPREALLHEEPRGRGGAAGQEPRHLQEGPGGEAPRLAHTVGRPEPAHHGAAGPPRLRLPQQRARHRSPLRGPDPARPAGGVPDRVVQQRRAVLHVELGAAGRQRHLEPAGRV